MTITLFIGILITLTVGILIGFFSCILMINSIPPFR